MAFPVFRSARQLPQARTNKGHISTKKFQTPQPSRRRRRVADPASDDDEAPALKKRRTQKPVKTAPAPSFTHEDPPVIPQSSKNEPRTSDDEPAKTHVEHVVPGRTPTKTIPTKPPEQSAWELEVAQQCTADAKMRAIYQVAVDQVAAICRIPFGRT